MTSVLLERGRDGIGLPLAAVGTGYMMASAARTAPWVEIECEGDVSAYVAEAPIDPILGERCSLAHLTGPWRLDPGWAAAFGAQTGGRVEGVAPGASVVCLTGRRGTRLHLTAGDHGWTADDPVLVVVTGGADLDAQGLGDLYGVIVVDEGSAWLDGTMLHGAVFATETGDGGDTGGLIYTKPVLRWATDRSLVRTRLVPGSRWEGTE